MRSRAGCRHPEASPYGAGPMCSLHRPSRCDNRHAASRSFTQPGSHARRSPNPFPIQFLILSRRLLGAKVSAPLAGARAAAPTMRPDRISPCESATRPALGPVTASPSWHCASGVFSQVRSGCADVNDIRLWSDVPVLPSPLRESLIASMPRAAFAKTSSAKDTRCTTTPQRPRHPPSTNRRIKPIRPAT